jgi:hypothetical protein
MREKSSLLPHFQLTVLSNYCAGHGSLLGLKHIYRRLLNRIVAVILTYRGADKSLARPRRKKATATEDFDVRISYL